MDSEVLKNDHMKLGGKSGNGYREDSKREDEV